MANKLKYGSSGDDVKKLQNALVSAGYDVGKSGADGVYGADTTAAVKKYQQDNGLAVDGIAGNDTLGALYGNSSTGSGTRTETAKAATTTPSATFSYDDFNYGKEFSHNGFSYDSYTPSDAVNQANAILQQQTANKPNAYQSQWQAQIDNYGNQIANREAFSYDPNSDALYNMYKDMYVQQGKMAMMDTMGQAAALTGGYGNSYAQAVGQQAYNQQLNQLNEVLPELSQMAYNRYQDEGQNLLNLYNMYMDRENQDYSRYQNDLSNWYNELEYLTNRYDTERNFDYSQWQTDRAQAYNEYTADRNLAYDQYTSDRNLAYDMWSTDKNIAWQDYQAALDRQYQQERDAIEDERWQMSYDEDLRRYEQNRQDALAKSYSSGSGSSTPSYSSLSLEEMDKLAKKFQGMTYDEAMKWAELYADQLGVNPAIVAAIASDVVGGPDNEEFDTDVELDEPPDETPDENPTDTPEATLQQNKTTPTYNGQIQQVAKDNDTTGTTAKNKAGSYFTIDDKKLKPHYVKNK